MKKEPEDLCNLVHVYEYDVWSCSNLSKILVQQVLSRVNNLNVEPDVPYTVEIFSRNVTLTLKPWNIECIVLN